MTGEPPRWPPGRIAQIDQQLAATVGELLGFAGHHNTVDMAPGVQSFTYSLIHESGLSRNRLAECVATLAITLLRDRPDLYLWAPDRLPKLANDPAPPGRTWDGDIEQIMHRLADGLPGQIAGTVPRTPVSMAAVYGRALSAIADLIDDDTMDPHHRGKAIRDLLDAIDNIHRGQAPRGH